MFASHESGGENPTSRQWERSGTVTSTPWSLHVTRACTPTAHASDGAGPAVAPEPGTGVMLASVEACDIRDRLPVLALGWISDVGERSSGVNVSVVHSMSA